MPDPPVHRPQAMPQTQTAPEGAAADRFEKAQALAALPFSFSA